ncbi:unnamed protein product [Closterium sp. NIES-54]
MLVWGVMGALTRYLTSPSIPMARSPGGLWAHSDPLLNKPFNPSGLVTGILTGRCRCAFAWGIMGAQTRYTNKPFYPNSLVVGILTRSTDTVHTEKGQGISHVHRLPRTEPSYHQVPLPHPASRRTAHSLGVLENRPSGRFVKK